MSDRRQLANRTNASKSTGPVTENGKSASSANATQHGILSGRLVLENENPADFQHLQLDLQASLAPVGAMELMLVERIAIGALWSWGWNQYGQLGHGDLHARHTPCPVVASAS